MRFLSPDYTYVLRYANSDADKRSGQLQEMDFSYNPPIECRFVGFRDFQDDTNQFAARLRANGRYSPPPNEWRKKVGGHNRKGLILHNEYCVSVGVVSGTGSFHLTALISTTA